MKKIISALLCAVMLISGMTIVSAASEPAFDFQVKLSRSNGAAVTDLKSLSKGDSLHVEIEVTRTDIQAEQYDAYGMECTLLSKGLRYSDGASTIRGSVSDRVYPASGKLEVSAKFLNFSSSGYYGTTISRVETVASWNYTVTDPSVLELTEEVMLMYPMDEEYFTVSFDPDGGSPAPAAQSVKQGDAAKEPQAPTKEGYTFKGWQRNGEPYDFSAPVTEALTLKAIWEKNSSDPVNPSDPSKPSDPTNPDDPSKPSDPTNPDDPSKPGDPSKPSDPTNPDDPSKPSDPTNPDDPSKPSEPSNPDNPSKPSEPSTPDIPSKPSEPSTPDNPSKPSEPSTPDNPSKPSDPTVPVDLNTENHFAYVVGYTDGTVRPQGYITRAETATLLYRLLTSARRDAIFTADSHFPDVQQKDWFNKAVASMANGGYINGYPGGTFAPDDNITRAEFVTMVVRFLGDLNGEASFKDVSEAHWAYRYIATAVQAGLITGYSDGSFGPDQAITRAEAMTILNRILHRGVNEESTLGNPMMFSDNHDKNAWFYYEVLEATNGHEYTGTRPSENWTSNEVGFVYDRQKYEMPDKENVA